MLYNKCFLKVRICSYILWYRIFGFVEMIMQCINVFGMLMTQNKFGYCTYFRQAKRKAMMNLHHGWLLSATIFGIAAEKVEEIQMI